MENDSSLVKKTLNGDVSSFSELVCRYQSRLYNFIFKLTLSHEDSEEIVQEVFLKIYNNLYKYNNKYCFSTWAYTIALNTFKSEYKKKKRYNYEELDESLLRIAGEESPEDIFVVKEDKREIFNIINSLNIEHKAAIILKYVEGLSYKEIGDILKISPDAAKMKVHRAKQILCKKYGNQEKRGVCNEV